MVTLYYLFFHLLEPWASGPRCHVPRQCVLISHWQTSPLFLKENITVFIIWSFKQIIIFIWCFCKHAHCELPLSLCTWTISSPFLKAMQFLCYKNTLTFILLGYLPVSSESGHSIFWLSWTYTCPSRTSHTTPPTSCWKLKRSKSISDRYLTTHRNRFKKFYWYNKLG